MSGTCVQDHRLRREITRTRSRVSEVFDVDGVGDQPDRSHGPTRLRQRSGTHDDFVGGCQRELDELALAAADEVVVCSRALAETRGAVRSVWLVPNAVDVEHFRNPRPRPGDLPSKPVVLYAGTAHDARIDVDLVVELASRLPQVTFAFVGPNALSRSTRQLLAELPNLVFLGPRPYRELPAYLQHADVVIVPHVVTPFMESLDPIKAYECMAIRTPTVATPLPGFREHSDVLNVVPRGEFAERVEAVLTAGS